MDAATFSLIVKTLWAQVPQTRIAFAWQLGALVYLSNFMRLVEMCRAQQYDISTCHSLNSELGLWFGGSAERYAS